VLLARAGHGRRVFGVVLLVLGALVVSGADKRLEALAVTLVPEWALAF
jgi:Na+/alanine symporter